MATTGSKASTLPFVVSAMRYQRSCRLLAKRNGSNAVAFGVRLLVLFLTLKTCFFGV
jgi:hypothetical protein